MRQIFRRLCRLTLANGWPPGRTGLAALLGLVFLAGGCVSSRPILANTSGPAWTVQQGQALWRPNRQRPELAGELVMATHADGSSSLEFAKPPFPIVRAQATRREWFIE